MPSDNALKEGFVLHVDAADTLDVASQPNSAIRNRFSIYPNPTISIIWAEDIAGIPGKAFLYNLAGRQVSRYSLTGRKNRLELPAWQARHILAVHCAEMERRI